MNGIINDIKKNLLQFPETPSYYRQTSGQVKVDRNTVSRQHTFDNGENRPDIFVNVYVLFPVFRVSRETEKVFDDPLCVLSLPLYGLEQFVEFRVLRNLFEHEVRETQNYRQRVIDLVGDTCCKCTKRRKLFGVSHLLFDLLFLRNFMCNLHFFYQFTEINRLFQEVDS